MRPAVGTFRGSGAHPWVTEWESGWWYTRYDYAVIGPFATEQEALAAWKEYDDGTS